MGSKLASSDTSLQSGRYYEENNIGKGHWETDLSGRKRKNLQNLGTYQILSESYT